MTLEPGNPQTKEPILDLVPRPDRDLQRVDITLVYMVLHNMLYNVSNNPVIYETI